MELAPLLTSVATSLAVLAQAPPAPQPVQWSGRDLTQLSLSELAATKVTSVSKKPEEQSKTAAAIDVITRDDIRRSGATTLVELLRLVPGVHLAHLQSSQWAIGIRGFTSRLARAQLAVMDGRSLYTPLFAGTYWELQDTLLEDVERIEVVRGPGGTLWGANAVTGIINVVTRSAADTQGGFVTLGGGSEERGALRARHGGRIGGGHFRVWGKYADHDAAFRADGAEFDDWRLGLGGFRADWARDDGETFTVSGGGYSGRLGSRGTLSSYTAPFVRTVEGRSPADGGHLIARWTRPLGGGELALQTYYDRSSRKEPTFRETRDTGDFDAQYALHIGRRHEIVVGTGYRLSDGRSQGVETLTFVPPDRIDHLWTAFVQDEIDVVRDRVKLTIGTKVERNSYTGFELQPTLRLGWALREPYFVWVSATRAVRTPSRIERDLLADSAVSATAPTYFRLQGSPDFQTETMLALEGGVRARFSERVSVDLAAFHNRHPNLLSLEFGRPFPEAGRQITPAVIANGIEGNVEGFEVAADVRLARRWMVRSGYSYLNMALQPRPGSTDVSTAAAEDASPRHRVILSSALDLPGGLSLDLRGRWMSRLPSQRVDAYASLDARASWRPISRLELAVVGQNLLEPHHAEFGGTGAAEIERSAYAEASWRW
jgi:iron complex outermembrane receptor protein